MKPAPSAPVMPLTNEDILAAVGVLLAEAPLHKKTRESISLAVLGLCFSPRLSVTAVGTSLAQRTGHAEKHGVKQVDRLLANDNFDVEACEGAYVRKVLGNRRHVVVALDWTEFALDGHSTICLHLITRHGRATPLVWLTVKSTALKDRRNEFEDEVLRRFKECLPERALGVVVLADRGFGDVALYAELEEELGFDFVIRFRCNVLVADTQGPGKRQRADAWLAQAGRRQVQLRGPLLTGKRKQVESFVGVHDAGMKEAWFLATSLPGSAKAIKLLYSKRFRIEETFRDTKDVRFGWGLYETQVTQTARRDRLLFIAALAHLLLMLLGAVGEDMDQDKHLRVNTATRRTHSLFRQGREYLKGRLADIATRMRARFREFIALLGTTTARYALI